MEYKQGGIGGQFASFALMAILIWVAYSLGFSIILFVVIGVMALILFVSGYGGGVLIGIGVGIVIVLFLMYQDVSSFWPKMEWPDLPFYIGGAR